MHRIYRFLTTKLILNPITYLFGMVLVRLSRKLKKKFISYQKEFVVIDNFMGNIQMRVDKNSYMGGSIYWNGFHHINELLFLKGFLKSDMTFIDVGANQGEFSLYAASLLKNGKVIAFEPTSFQLGLLKDNVELNNFSNVEINNYGLFDKSCQLKVYTSTDIKPHSGIHEGLSSLYQSESRNELEEVIDLKVFDDIYLNKLVRIDFVKIDIEGAELSALQGMKQSLQKFKPIVLVELNKETFNNAGYDVKDVMCFFDEINYSSFTLFRGRKLPNNNLKEDIEYGNYLFFPADRKNDA